jgi:hypothetical protein
VRRFAGAMAFLLLVLLAGVAAGQQPEEATRAGLIEQAQAEKAADLHPFVPGKGEDAINNAADLFLTGGLHWYPYFTSPYSGGGVPLGVGYVRFVSPSNQMAFRTAFTISGYMRFETEFFAPRLFDRRGVLTVVGGWRQATQAAYYGAGMGSTLENRANFGFQQPYASATLDVRPTRGLFLIRGGFEETQWKEVEPGSSNYPPVHAVYTPQTLPGLGSSPIYAHSQAMVAFDSRTSPGYSRRGTFLGVTAHDYTESNGQYGFNEITYDAVQHIPILREAWVISLRGRADTTYEKGNEQIPYFMLPALGGGDDLRAYSSWRYRDKNSLLLQAEWRVMVNRFVDTAVFYDAGKVTASRTDLNLKGLQNDYGIGFRFHGPLSTPLRIDLAWGREGLGFVFAAAQVF